MEKLRKMALTLLFVLILVGLCPTTAWAESVDESANDAQLVGEGDIIIAENIIATFDKEAGELVLFSKEGGTLDKDWISDWEKESGYEKYDIKSIKVSDTSDEIYFPADSSRMFSECSELTKLDVKGFNTSNVVNMNSMFCNCSALKSLSLDGFSTSNVTSMAGMFENCYGLKNLDISSFDTSSVINMNNMFSSCVRLESLDLSNFNTENVTSMGGMFNMSGFIDANDWHSDLINLNLSSFDTSNVINMDRMFSSCNGLTNLDLSNFDTSRTTTMSRMFEGCSSLTKLDLSNFDTSNVTDTSFMFSGCSGLINLDLISFNTSSVTDMSWMFYGCSSLTNLDLSSFDTSNVTNMNIMFYNCNSLTNLDLSGFDTSNVEYIHDFFVGCDSLDILRTPKINITSPAISLTMYDKEGNTYTSLPILSESIVLASSQQLAGETSNPVSGVVLDKTEAVVTRGDSLKLTADVLPNTAYNKTVKWESSDETIAEVSQDGFVTARKAGSADITAITQDGGFTAVCNLTVIGPRVSGVTLSQNSITWKKGFPYSPSLRATIKPFDAANKAVTWISSDESIVTVDDNGNLSILKVGSVVVTVVTVDGGFSASCNVTVTAPDVSNIILDQTSVTLKRGERAKISATIEPYDAIEKTPNWSSSDDNIVTVDQRGNISALKTGTALIYAYTGDVAVSCEVTVIGPDVSGIALDHDRLTLKRGKSSTLVATVEPFDAENRSLIWTSSDKNVAEVDESGKIIALKVGTTDITATTVDGGFAATCNLTVVAPDVAGVTLSQNDVVLKRGETATLRANVEPYDAENKSIIWTSSDGTVAEVNEFGKITTLKVGTTTITVTTVDGGFTATCALIVEAPDVSGVDIDIKKANIYEGRTLQITATIEPEDAANRGIKWISSDNNVVMVDKNGLVTAIKEGSAIIAATSAEGGFTAICNVTVKKKVTFTDVADSSAWYYDSVYWAVENGVTSGMGEGTFQPMAKLSRAQAVTFLYKLAGQPDVSGLQTKEFSDVAKSAWYYNAVKWAVSNEITSGYGEGTFQPNVTCNRAMIVTFLMRYSKLAGTYTAPTTSASFKDVSANAWYKEAVDWAVASGVTSGYGEGTFQPMVTCNRAMMVTFLRRVAEMPKI
ncbi:MAG: Ig-like domain-containing protein [Lachnospiraceae bacterium]|nr:Ig-like domain-containing protein [Lachnospiraceae bacterium]